MATATNPQTGEKVVQIGGEWLPFEQSATNEAGEKVYLVGDEWVSDAPETKYAASEFDPFTKVHDYDPFTFGNIVGSAVEPMMALGSGAAGLVTSGVAGLGAMGARELGFDTGDPAEVVRATQEAMTYQPRSDSAKAIMDAIIGAPMRSLEEKTEFTGQQAAEQTGSPAYGAVTKAMLQTAPMVAGARLAPSGKPLIPKLDKTITAPARGVKAVTGAVVKAGKNIFPRHRERAGRMLGEAAGKDFDPIVEALARAEMGETAGQATAGVGRAEFSAIEKLMAGERDPTTYGQTGRVREAQQAARKEDIGKYSRTPEELATAEKALKVKSKKEYGKSKDDLIGQIPEELASRPSIKAAIETARSAATEKGIYFPKKGKPYSVANLQRIKRDLSDTMADTTTQGSLKKTQQGEVGETLGLFTDWLRKESPKFAKAEDMYATEIKPIVQMKILQSLESVLKPRLGGKDRFTQFVNALENTKTIIKKATGRDAPLHEILTEKQMAAVNKARAEIDRDVTLKEKGTEGYKKMTKVIGETLDPIEAPGMISSPMMIFRNLMNRLKGRASEKTMKVLEENWDKPKEIAKLMKEFSPKGKEILKDYLKQRNKLIVGAAIGAAENQ